MVYLSLQLSKARILQDGRALPILITLASPSS